MALHELDTARTTVSLVDDGDGKSWPAGTVGTVVDLVGDDGALLEVADSDGRTLALLSAGIDELAPVAARTAA